MRSFPFQAILIGTLALVPCPASVMAAGTFGPEHVVGVSQLDGIDLTHDEVGNLYGVFRKWRDGPDHLQLVVYSAAERRWRAPVAVPDSDFVAPLPVWRTNSPDIAYNPVTGLVYIAYGPESREDDNGLFLQAYDPATGLWRGLRQIHSNQSEHNAMVVLPGGDLLVISVEIQPFDIAEYRYSIASLNQLYGQGGNNVRPVRKVIDTPVSSFPEAEVDSHGNVHLATRWVETFYFRRDALTGAWKHEKTYADVGGRTQSGESCGNQHDGDPGLVIDHRTDAVYLLSTPWDYFKPSCRPETDGPQNLYLWDARTTSFELLSDRPSYFIANYVPKAAINAQGDIFVMWPENFGYHFQHFSAVQRRWLQAPQPIPSSGRFDNPDPFKAYADGDVAAVGNTFHLLYRDHSGKLHASTYEPDPVLPVPLLSPLGALLALGGLGRLLGRSPRRRRTAARAPLDA